MDIKNFSVSVSTLLYFLSHSSNLVVGVKRVKRATATANILLPLLLLLLVLFLALFFVLLVLQIVLVVLLRQVSLLEILLLWVDLLLEGRGPLVICVLCFEGDRAPLEWILLATHRRCERSRTRSAVSVTVGVTVASSRATRTTTTTSITVVVIVSTPIFPAFAAAGLLSPGTTVLSSTVLVYTPLLLVLLLVSKRLLLALLALSLLLHRMEGSGVRRELVMALRLLL